jgi:hypothetical protein
MGAAGTGAAGAGMLMMVVAADVAADMNDAASAVV